MSSIKSSALTPALSILDRVKVSGLGGFLARVPTPPQTLAKFNMDTYVATNRFNGKFYIGSTTNFKRRKKDHLRSKENYPFQNALRKNPEEFEWEVWSDDSDEPILEQALLDMWFGKECCYNLNPSASRPPTCLGKAQSEGARRKISEANRGERHPMFGKSHTEGAKRKMRDAAKRKKPDSKETRLKKSLATSGSNNPMHGKTHTDSAKEKISKANQGQNNPMYGRRHSGESNHKNREAHLGKVHTQEAKMKMSRARVGKKWWVNPAGDTLKSDIKPEGDWQRGRVYRG